MKRMLSVIFTLIMVVLSVFPASAVFDSGAVTNQLKSDAYYLQSLDEGTVLFKKNEEKKLPAAGFVKIISAVVAIEKWSNLDEKIKVTDKNRSLVKYDYGVRTAGYKTGESVSKRELIDTLVVYSANDSASIIAYEIGSSLEGFLSEMSALLSKIGCTSTVIKNITGFDADGQYTTAGDVAKIISYAMNYPVFVEAFSATEVTLKATSQNEERTFSASNRMRNSNVADYYHASVNAGKQTATDGAGECIAVISNQDGYTYLTIVMNGHLEDIDSDGVQENTAMTDAKRMLDWIYKNIRYRVVVSPSQVVATIDVVAGSNSDTVKLVPEKEASALVPSNATPASVLYEIVEGSAPAKLQAPIKQGEVIAKAKVYYAGQELSEINLVAQEDIGLSFFGLIASKVSAIMSSTFFIVFVGFAALGCLIYLLSLVKKYFLDGNEKAEEIKKELLEKMPIKKAPSKKAPVKKTSAQRPAQKRNVNSENNKK